MKQETIFRTLMIAIFVTLILIVGTVAYISSILFPLATNIIDISIALEPVEPYDIAKLETVLEINNTHWIVVVKYIDVDTNTTIYETLVYNLESKTFENHVGDEIE